MRYTILFLFAISSFTIFAQEETKFEFDYTIKSDAFGDDRNITVYLPPAYYEDKDEVYAVTYVLDGHYDPLVDLGVKIIEYGVHNRKYSNTIVVGIHQKKRGWEFSNPIDDIEEEEESDYEGGRSPELRKHLKDEVFPFVDSLNLRINRFRSVIGHSSGGVFVLGTLFSQDYDMFDGYIAISPGIRINETKILDRIASVLEAGEKRNKFLYCSSGTFSKREELFGGAVASLDSMFNKNPNHGLIWKKVKFQGTGHFTCVAPSFNDGMLELTRAFQVDEKMLFDFAYDQKIGIKEDLDNFYETRNKNYKYTFLPSSLILRITANEISNKKYFDEADQLLDWAIEKYPNDFKLVRGKAYNYKKMGKIDKAMNAFTKCLEMLDENVNNNEPEYIQKQKGYIAEGIEWLKE